LENNRSDTKDLTEKEKMTTRYFRAWKGLGESLNKQKTKGDHVQRGKRARAYNVSKSETVTMATQGYLLY